MASIGIKTSYVPSSGGSSEQAAIFREEQERIRRVIAAVHFCQEGEKLTEDEVVAMIRYCDAHSDSDVVRRQESGLARTVLTGDEGYILMTLNSSKGDRLIGKGAFKKAKLAVSTKTGKVGIVTVCREGECIGTRDPRAWDRAKAEIQCMQQLKGEEGVVQIVAAHVTDNASSGGKAFTITPKAPGEEDVGVEAVSCNKAYIVMEYCKEGDLFDALIEKPSRLQPDDQRQIALDCARGMNNMRKKNLIHRDVKPENVFLNGKRNVHAKVGDFGYACLLGDINSQKEVVGSVSWFSPEKAKAHRAIRARVPLVSADCAAASTEASDVWTLGLLFATTLRPKSYYLRCQDDKKDTDRGAAMASVKQTDLDKEINDSKIYPEFKPLIKGMLRVKPSERPTMAYVQGEVERISKKMASKNESSTPVRVSDLLHNF